MTGDEFISCIRHGTVAVVTLRNGERNLLNPKVMDELEGALRRADLDEEVRAIVLTGHGNSFCGGLDIEQLQRGADPVAFSSALVDLLKVFPKLNSAVVAAVNGDALASGFSLVCASDLALARPEARMGCFEASVGLWPMISQVPPLQRLLPRHALRNIMTGASFSADEALRVGVINGIEPQENLIEAARELAAQATGSGAALGPGRRLFYELLDMPYEQALDRALEEFRRMFQGG